MRLAQVCKSSADAACKLLQNPHRLCGSPLAYHYNAIKPWLVHGDSQGEPCVEYLMPVEIAAGYRPYTTTVWDYLNRARHSVIHGVSGRSFSS
jgi:hypothetical protein